MTRNATTARLIGTGSSQPTEKDAFYSTPPECTKALLSVEQFEQDIWEPACGQGHISKVLEDAGARVISTDLVDRGYGIPRVDFLMERNLLAPTIITNPPFKFDAEFADKAIQLGARKIALLCKLSFLEGKKRTFCIDGAAQHGCGLKAVYPFINRVALHKDGIDQNGSGMLAFAWFVWERGHRAPPIIKRIIVQKKGS